MRNTIIATASVMMLLAGCSGMDNDRSSTGMSGSSGQPSASTSGNSTTVVPPRGPMGAVSGAKEGGMDSRNISPDEPGLGSSPTRESLTNPNRAGSGSSGSTPYPRTSRNQTENRNISPDEPGLGQSQTRRSLPNSAGTQ